MPNFPNQYEDVKVELVRIDGNVNTTTSHCANVTYNDGPTSFPLSNSKQKHTQAPDPLCLEEGAWYQIKFTIDQYDVNNPDSKSSILIDSVRINFLQDAIWRKITSLSYFRLHSSRKSTPYPSGMLQEEKKPRQYLTTLIAAPTSLLCHEATSPRTAVMPSTQFRITPLMSASTNPVNATPRDQSPPSVTNIRASVRARRMWWAGGASAALRQRSGSVLKDANVSENALTLK